MRTASLKLDQSSRFLISQLVRMLIKHGHRFQARKRSTDCWSDWDGKDALSLNEFSFQEVDCDRHVEKTVQEAVSLWHCLVFSGRGPLATAKKCLEEASELHCEAKTLESYQNISNDSSEIASQKVKVVEEAADTAIVCYALAGMLQADLDSAIRDKIQKLRNETLGIEPKT